MHPVTTVFLVDQDMYHRKALSRSYQPLRLQWPLWLRLPKRAPRSLLRSGQGRRPSSITGSVARDSRLVRHEHVF